VSESDPTWLTTLTPPPPLFTPLPPSHIRMAFAAVAGHRQGVDSGQEGRVQDLREAGRAAAGCTASARGGAAQGKSALIRRG